MILVEILAILVGWIFFALVAPILFLIVYGVGFLPWILILLLKKRRQFGKTTSKNWSSNKEQIAINSKQLSCLHCGQERFSKREGLLITSWAAFFYLFFWLSKSATCYECVNCGYISWFSCPKELEFSSVATNEIITEENKNIETESIHK